MDKLIGEIEVVCKHTFEINLEDLKGLSRYDLNDIEQLNVVLKEDINDAGINNIKGYKFIKESYDLDDLKLKIKG